MSDISEELEERARYCIDVLCVEFDDGGNTLWVQGRTGTVLRIKLSGKIKVDLCPESLSGSHADVEAQGDMRFCVGNDRHQEEG
jgi:hypothetical protein